MEVRRLPRQAERVLLWELGSERQEDRFAFHFCLSGYKVRPGGECALVLRLNNNLTAPDGEMSEFSILALPADLDRLADLLEGFAKLEHQVLEWNVVPGELRAGI